MGSNPAIPTIDLGGGPHTRPAVPALQGQVHVLADILHALGYGLCHQIPERSFIGGGVQAPVCARDAGIYLGFAVSLIVIRLLHGAERPREFPRLPAWIAFAACVAFMGWDGVTSYAGLRESTNLLRLVTGMGTGFSAAAIVTPMLNDTVWRAPGRTRLFDPWWRLALWVAAIPVSTAVFWFVGPLLGVGYPVLIALAILITLTAINLVIVAMLPAFDRKAQSVRGLLFPTTIALLMAFAEIWAAGLLREALVRLGSSLS